MLFNYNFWASQLKDTFPSQIQGLVTVLESKLVPSFSDIDSEATAIQNKKYEELCRMPYDDRFDTSDLHEAAFEAGLEHYQLMSGIKQGLINMFAASLFHLYEQQVMFYHRREILSPREENDSNLLKHSIFSERLNKAGINIKKFSCHDKINELSFLANTIKHGQGQSSEKLFAIRSDLFQHPTASKLGFNSQGIHRVFTPVLGEDIYVSLKDIKEYASAIKSFWLSLAEAIEKISNVR